MLHIIHMIERRHGRARASSIVLRLLLGSALLLALGLGLLLSGRAMAQDAATPDPVATATRLLDRLDAGAFTDAEAMFSPEMAAAVPADKLKAVWESLPAQAGKATGRGTAKATAGGGGTLVEIPLQYEKAALLGRIAVGSDGRIVGFQVQPAPAPVVAAPVAEDAAYVERDMAVG